MRSLAGRGASSSGRNDFALAVARLDSNDCIDVASTGMLQRVHQMTLATTKLEIKGSRSQLLGPFLISAVFTFALLAMALGLIGASPSRVAIFVGKIGAVIFASVSCVYAWRFVNASKNVIVLSSGGLLDIRLSKKPIAWASIGGVRELFHRNNRESSKLIIISVSKDAETAIGLTPIQRWTRSASKALGVHEVFISAQGLDISHDRLLQNITDRVTEAKSASHTKIL